MEFGVIGIGAGFVALTGRLVHPFTLPATPGPESCTSTALSGVSVVAYRLRIGGEGWATNVADNLEGTMNHKVDLVGRLYEPLVTDAREHYRSTKAWERIVDPDASSDFIDRFLIEFCSMGVHMTEPVDRWIRAAGRRCCELGLERLGTALQRHADHEAGHHLMMINDTKALVDVWNTGRRDGGAELDARQLLSRPPSPGCRAYIALHEETIASSTPWGQLAIEYEVERLSITAGPVLMANVAAVSGEQRVEMLSFLADHIALDEGHTVFNRRQLNDLLAQHPESAEDLGRCGSAALVAHAHFLSDCVEAASCGR